VFGGVVVSGSTLGVEGCAVLVVKVGSEGAAVITVELPFSVVAGTSEMAKLQLNDSLHNARLPRGNKSIRSQLSVIQLIFSGISATFRHALVPHSPPLPFASSFHIV
jgi:hypothetical protein